MIKLYQFQRAFGVPNPSPFCMKVETYLRLTGLDYEISLVSNPAKAPKGKCPYIEDAGQAIADSHFILAYLKKAYGDPLGEGLSPADRAQHLVLTRMMEGHLYFTLLHGRWIQPQNAPFVRDLFFSSVPSLMRGLVFAMVQRQVGKVLHGQGIGRHTTEEIDQLAIEDLGALEAILGSQAYFGGDAPREIDCVAWGFIANALAEPFQSPVKDAAKAMPGLVAYSARMMEGVFPELAKGAAASA